MIKVGNYVKFNSATEFQYGIVTKIENDETVEVFFKYPRVYSMFVRKNLLEKITELEYCEAVGIPYEITGNKTIDNVKDNTKSIEQQIDDMFYTPDGDGWAPYDDDTVNAYFEKENLFIEEFTRELQQLCKSVIKMPDGEYVEDTPKLDAKWEEALKEAYIDMALATGDEEWFKKLTNS